LAPCHAHDSIPGRDEPGVAQPVAFEGGAGAVERTVVDTAMHDNQALPVQAVQDRTAADADGEELRPFD